ncbi:MAG: DUF4138 domain-containing protein [Ginsengibacter sp.]
MTLRSTLFSLLVFVSVYHRAHAQADTLRIGYDETTSLSFPLMIHSVDRGTGDILVQKVRGLDNILQVKSARRNFGVTNMTVITADGTVYPFIVSYSERPPLHLQVGDSASLFDRVAHDPRSFNGPSDSKYDLSLRVSGIYYADGILYFRLQVENTSNLPFHTGVLRFLVADRRQGKRTASQEWTLKPLYTWGDTGTLPGQSQTTWVIAFRQFTIPGKKWLRIALTEEGGGRNLRLRVTNRKIVKAFLLITH